MCISVSLSFLSDLLMHDYMLQTMVCIVYHYAFVGEAAVFDLLGKLSEFAL